MSGLKWRVYREQAEPDGSHPLVAESSEASPLLILPDGSYIVHVAFGLAGATRRVDLHGQSASERIVLNAGALRILPMQGDTPLPPQRVSISVFVPDRNNPEGRLVAANMRPGALIACRKDRIMSSRHWPTPGRARPAASVVPTNSVVSADLRVQAGKLVEDDVAPPRGADDAQAREIRRRGGARQHGFHRADTRRRRHPRTDRRVSLHRARGRRICRHRAQRRKDVPVRLPGAVRHSTATWRSGQNRK